MLPIPSRNRSTSVATPVRPARALLVPLIPITGLPPLVRARPARRPTQMASGRPRALARTARFPPTALAKGPASIPALVRQLATAPLLVRHLATAPVATTDLATAPVLAPPLATAPTTDPATAPPPRPRAPLTARATTRVPHLVQPSSSLCEPAGGVARSNVGSVAYAQPWLRKADGMWHWYVASPSLPC